MILTSTNHLPVFSELAFRTQV